MKHKLSDLEDDLRDKYDFDFTKGERGRYSERLLKEDLEIVVLESDNRRSLSSTVLARDLSGQKLRKRRSDV
jgi:hypothetical protein